MKLSLQNIGVYGDKKIECDIIDLVRYGNGIPAIVSEILIKISLIFRKRSYECYYS